MRSGRLLVGAAQLGLGLLAITCRQVAGIDDRVAELDASTPEPDAPPALSSLSCGAFPGFEASDGDECRACLAGGCCGEGAACRADAECAAALGCIAGCGTSADTQCAEKCEQLHAAALPLASAALACRVERCAEPCGDAARCGRPPGPATPCATCLDQTCCAAELAAWGSPAARQFEACARECSKDDLDCWLACGISHPGGYSYFGALNACGYEACAAVCELPETTKCGLPVISLPACDVCGAEPCCAELRAVFEDPTSIALGHCLGGCGGSAGCAQGCYGKASNHANALLSASNNCLASSCAAECGFPESAKCGLTVPSGPCGNCMITNCCEAGLLGSKNVDAIEYQLCLDSCISLKCEVDCANQFPTGKKLLDALAACYTDKCADSCFPSNLDAGTD